jgi:ribosomal-protein-alanine N-acetyltransferase
MLAKTMRSPSASTIRAFRETDAAAATEILKGSLEAAQWTEWGVRELLRWSGVVALVSEDGRKVSGFIVGRQAGGEAEILNLAVTPAKRRKGRGGVLLNAAMDEFHARLVSRLFLEVRESNEGGIAFYQKHGFLKMGRRASYYHNPDEAAIVMEKKLAG